MDSSCGSADTGSGRLAPRTSGRRFRRQQEDKQEAVDSDPATIRRRPRDDVESRIDAAIGARKRQVNLALSEEDLPGETEILGNYEYLDHTADIQLHSWGDSFEDALKMQLLAMNGYMTKLSLVQVDENASKTHALNIEARGHDMQSLVFAFLQEWLTRFHETGFLARDLVDVHFDRRNWTIKASGKGEVFDSNKHTQGTEVKAVTYSNLSVKEADGRCDIWVIVDI